MLADVGTDWDPTTTMDDMLLVWSIDRRLNYADRAMPEAPFTHRGLLGVTELTGMDVVSPALSADGLSIVVTARVGGVGVESLFELTRGGRAAPFSAPMNIAKNMEVIEPGLDASGQHLVAIAGSSLVTATRAGIGVSFTTTAGRIAVELDAYSPRFPALSADGLTVAFTSSFGRPSDDIFVARRADVDAPFGTPVLVSGVNDDAADDQDPWLGFDDTALYFSSDRRDPTRVWDIYVSRRTCT